MSGVSTAFIDRCALFSEGVREILGNRGFDIVASASDFEDFSEKWKGLKSISLIIICINDDYDAMERNIISFKQYMPDAKIVMLSDNYNIKQVQLDGSKNRNCWLCQGPAVCSRLRYRVFRFLCWLGWPKPAVSSQ